MKTALLAALASLMAITAQAQIGWTLDQCKAKYGEAITIPWVSGENNPSPLTKSDPEGLWQAATHYQPDGQGYLFKVSGFKIAISFINGVAIIVGYEPETPLTYKQAREILAKNSNTVWKRETDPDLSDETSDMLTTKDKSKHELEAELYFNPEMALLSGKGSGPDHNSIICVVVRDDTVDKQILDKNMAENAAKEKADKEKQDKQSQDSVNGL